MKAYDYKLLDQSVGEIVDTALRTGARVAGPIPLPTEHQPLHGAARAAHRQEVARAVRDPHAQAADRHPRSDAPDGGRADEARARGRRRRGDQALSHGRPWSSTRPAASRAGSVELDPAVFEAAVQAASLPRRGAAPARPAARGHALDQEPRGRLGRRHQALEAEGHRPRAPGHDPRAAVGRRRRRVRAGAARATSTRCPRRCARRRCAARCRCACAKAQLAVVEALALEAPRTKLLLDGARAGSASQGVAARRDRAARPRTSSSPPATCRACDVLRAEGLNVYDVLRHERLLLTRGRWRASTSGSASAQEGSA